MSEEWLVVKRGLYYMPNDCGYTGIKDHAGRYTEAESIERAQSEGVSRIKFNEAPEFTTACFDDQARDHLTKQRDDAREENQLLRSALKAITQLGGRNDLPDAWEIAHTALGDR